MAYPPSSNSSSTIWLGGVLFVVGVSCGGTCTSSAIRESGCVIMKMISSTSSTSIIGVTLMSDCTPADAPVVIAMSLLLLFVLTEDHASVRLGDGSHYPDTGPAGGLHRLLYLGVLELIVRLEVEDFVLGPRGEDAPELVFERPVCNRPLVEEVATRLIDAEHYFVLAFRAGIEILALGQCGLEPGRDKRGHDHEDDQEHQHDVDHRRHVDVRLDRRRAGGITRGYGHCRSPPSGP